MQDFIPDNQAVPDEQQTQTPNAQAELPNSAPAFIPDEQAQSDEDKYTSLPEQAKAFAEKAASAASFGQSTKAEIAAGIANPQDILNRQKYSLGPVGNILATGAGIAAQSAIAPEIGIGRIGELAGGLVENGIGSMAARIAAENAALAAGDEASKMYVNDPAQSAETAAANIGLSALMGGAIGGIGAGVVPPIWKAARESKVGQILSILKDKANGLNEYAVPENVQSSIEKSGMNVDPVIQSAISGDPKLAKSFTDLMESQTTSGDKAKELLGKFNDDVKNSIVESLGKTPEDIENLRDYSPSEQGQAIQNTLKKEISDIYKPISDQYNAISDKYSNLGLGDNLEAEINNSLNVLSDEGGYKKYEGSPEQAIIDKAMKSLPQQETLEDLRKLASNVGADAADKNLWDFRRKILNIFQNAEEQRLEEKLGEEAPDLLGQHQAIKSQYRDMLNTIEDLNARLHVGKYGGVTGFLHNLTDMNPETVLNRLTPKNDAGLLKMLDQKFPATSQAIKENYLNQLVKTAANRAKNGELLSVAPIQKAVKEWSPELRKYVLPEGAEERIDAVNDLLSRIPKKPSSHTAGNLDRLWRNMLPSIGGLIGYMHGGFGAALEGGLIGKGVTAATREIPDYLKLSILKFLGSDEPINASAFKAMLDYTQSVVRGEKLTTQAVKSVLNPALELSPSQLIPKYKETEKLDKAVDNLQSNNEKFLDVGGETGYYLPHHAAQSSALTVRAVQYLSSIKPQSQKLGPLDPEIPPTKAEMDRYHRALQVAQSPLVTMDYINAGILTPQDVMTFKTIYPNLYSSVSQKIVNGLVDIKAKKKLIPYQKRLALSLFLGSPLDYSMQPQTIAAAQPMVPIAPQIAQQEPSQSHRSGSMKNINKLAKNIQTPLQARMIQKINNKV